jgi:hypothetical protein
MAHWLLMILALVAFASPARAQESACGVGHLVTVEPDGSVSRGAKEQVRRAAANGVPLRVGWSIDANTDGVADLVHWSDSGFVTIWEGEVFAQIPDIQRQGPVRGQASVRMPAGRQRWTGILSTTGVLEGHFDDGSEPMSTRLKTIWCVDPRAATCTPQWRMVYRHDADGRPLDGTRQALLDAIRRGAPLRVAWGFAGNASSGPVAVEHAIDPVFVTVMNGEHVFVQLPEHIAQTSYSQPEGARFDRASVMWRGLMGTTGAFDAVFVDRATGREVRRFPQRAGLAWFAELPAPDCAAQAPLTLAVPDGVRVQPQG